MWEEGWDPQALSRQGALALIHQGPRGKAQGAPGQVLAAWIGKHSKSFDMLPSSTSWHPHPQPASEPSASVHQRCQLREAMSCKSPGAPWPSPLLDGPGLPVLGKRGLSSKAVGSLVGGRDSPTWCDSDLPCSLGLPEDVQGLVPPAECVAAPHPDWLQWGLRVSGTEVLHGCWLCCS